MAGICALAASIEKATRVMAKEPRAISFNIPIALYITVGDASNGVRNLRRDFIHVSDLGPGWDEH
jgi:hypothetical protein